MPEQNDLTPNQGYPYPTPPAQPPAAPEYPAPATPPQPAETIPERSAAQTQTQAPSSDPEIVDRRPSAWVDKPLPIRLVGTDEIERHLTFVTASPRDGGTRLERWWMPDASAAMERVPGEALAESLENASASDVILSFHALRASSIDDDALQALMSLPMESTIDVLNRWMGTRNAEGTTAGESRGSAPA